MRKIARAGAVVVAAAAIAGFGVPAGAATTNHHGFEFGEGFEGDDGLIQVCNHSGYLFNVFADGPSVRTDDLAGSFDECTHWHVVEAGQYIIGFGLRTASTQKVIIQARIKRGNRVFYENFSDEGKITTNVGEEQRTRVDLFIPQG